MTPKRIYQQDYDNAVNSLYGHKFPCDLVQVAVKSVDEGNYLICMDGYDNRYPVHCNVVILRFRCRRSYYSNQISWQLETEVTLVPNPY